METGQPEVGQINKQCLHIFTRLLPSWPMVKILSGPVHFRVTLKKFLEVKLRAITRFSALLACAS